MALGAWPLYELALLLDRTLDPARARQIWQWEPLRQLTRPLALALALAYLLDARNLQSAMLTEFHAVPLAAPLILWALWAVEARRWRQFVAGALLVACVKEETALLAAVLGLWAVWRSVVVWWAEPMATRAAALSWALARGAGRRLLPWRWSWFYVATFVIVPGHAAAGLWRGGEHLLPTLRRAGRFAAGHFARAS